MFRICIRLFSLFLILLAVAPQARPAPVDVKRRNPEVLAPVEFQADFVRVAVRTYMILTDRDGTERIGVVTKNKTGKAKEIKYISFEEFNKLAALTCARDILPLRVAVVTASFPFRKQIEAFQEALQVRSIDELRDEPSAFPRFQGFNVERRETDPKKTNWRPLDLESAKSPYRAVVAQTLKEFEPEPEKWKLVRVSGLVTPFPVLARGCYPECSLPLLAKTLADPKARGLPDYCLLRFLDVTVEPGRTYEYRVQVRMANPNHGKKTRVEKESLAEPKELLGPWTSVPGTVTLSPEISYYVADPRLSDPTIPGLAADRDEVAFQCHRWLPFWTPNVEKTEFSVGRWVVAERCLVSRGTRLGGSQPVLLPIWSPEEDRYIEAERLLLRGLPDFEAFESRLTGIIRRARVRVAPSGVSVYFGPTADPPEDAPLLVDFGGVKVAHKRVEAEAPVEVLLLSADGKLLARNSEADAADPVRRRHYADWRDLLDQARQRR